MLCYAHHSGCSSASTLHMHNTPRLILGQAKPFQEIRKVWSTPTGDSIPTLGGREA